MTSVTMMSAKTKIYFIAILGVIVDQITKFLVVSNFDVGLGRTIIKSFFSIVYIQNTGAAWGIFSDGTLILSIVSTLFLIFFFIYISKLKYVSKLNSIAYGMFIGGIVGNLIDRVVRHYVVDFLSFDIFGHPFPVFNIADSLIVISIILIIIESLIKEMNENDSR